MLIREVIKKYKSGELNNDIDEKYAGGFWDVAGEITDKLSKLESFDEKQDEIYQTMTEMYRILTNK